MIDFHWKQKNRIEHWIEKKSSILRNAGIIVDIFHGVSVPPSSACTDFQTSDERLKLKREKQNDVENFNAYVNTMHVCHTHIATIEHLLNALKLE